MYIYIYEEYPKDDSPMRQVLTIASRAFLSSASSTVAAFLAMISLKLLTFSLSLDTAASNSSFTFVRLMMALDLKAQKKLPAPIYKG